MDMERVTYRCLYGLKDKVTSGSRIFPLIRGHFQPVTAYVTERR